LHRRYFPIAILTGILLITAIAGYLIPLESSAQPVRILLPNKGGNVIFTHEPHISIQDDQCVTCHHTTLKDDDPIACKSCHVKTFDETFIIEHPTQFDDKQCASCHHADSNIDRFTHDDHALDYADSDCQSCHHDESIEPEPQACSNCHQKEGKDDIPSLKVANHTRCASCHDDMFDQGVEGCGYCHVRNEQKEQKTADQEACSSCHEESIDQLIPTTTVAFHGQCRGCHETMDAGPYGDENCDKCHMN